MCYIIELLDKWQTLVAGGLALIGAMWTVYYIHRQIKQVDDLEKARRSREELAARAVLPLALSQLVQYANECLQLIKDHSMQPENLHRPPLGENIELPTVQRDIIGTLQACVRYGDDNVVAQISTLLATLQVQQARLRDLISRRAQWPNRRIPRVQALDVMIDAAEVHAKASALFEYGREVADMRAKSTRQEINSAFFRIGIVTADEADLNDVLNRRYPEVAQNH
jgi:hypothetical protein